MRRNGTPVLLFLTLAACRATVSECERAHVLIAREDRPLRGEVDTLLRLPPEERLERLLRLNDALPSAPWVGRDIPPTCPHTPPHGGDLIHELVAREELALLLEAVRTRRMQTRNQLLAIRTLTSRGGAVPFPVLVELFAPQRPLEYSWTRVALANGIAEYLDQPAFGKEALELLTFHLLLDPDSTVRAWIAFALEDCDDPEALRVLESSMEWDHEGCGGPSCKILHRVSDHSRRAADIIRARLKQPR